MSETVLGIIVAAIGALAGFMVRVSAKAGALEQRVKTLELDHQINATKLDRLLIGQQETREAVIRLETKLEERLPK